jgi:hypothetical protein
MTDLNPDQFRGIAGNHILNELSDNLDPIWDKYDEAFATNTGNRPTNSTLKVAKSFSDVAEALHNTQKSHETNDPAGTWYHLNALNDHLENFSNNVILEDYEGRVPAKKIHNLHTEIMSGLTHVRNAKHSYSELYRVNEPPKEGE